MKLIAGGCSLTYGFGLSDCFSDNKITPSKHSELSWPGVLSRKLGIDYVNTSGCGASNMEIIYKLLSSNIVEGDLVVILWSYLDRDVSFKENGTYQYGSWDNDYIKNKITLYTDTDSVIKNLIHIHNFTKFLESKKVLICYSFVDKLEREVVSSKYLDFFDYLYNEIKKYDVSEDTWIKTHDLLETGVFGRSLDNLHPDEDFQKHLGDNFFNVLKKTKLT